MSKKYQLIYAMNSFSTGILLPVLSLVLLEKGATLQTLPLLLAVIGGLCASLFSSIFIIQLRFSGLLTASAALMGCYAVSSYIFSNMRRSSSFSDLKN